MSALTWTGAGLVALVLALAGLCVQITRFSVLRRLRRLEAAAHAIASGDLSQRLAPGGSDAIGHLAEEFNAMADSVTALVVQINGQQQRLETVINSIDDGIVVLDEHRTVLAANDAFLTRTGHVREAVLGCSCRSVGPGTCTEDCPAIACAKTGLRQVRICERRLPDGTVRWEEVHASPIVGGVGQAAQVVEVWRDISDRRSAEARLAESHRLASLGMLASGFSHELNTPLATVLMCVEGILRDAATVSPDSAVGSQIGQRAGIAREQLLRCRGITQHFLRLSRGQPTAPTAVDLFETVTSAARLVGPTATAHAVRLVVPERTTGGHVRADEAAIQHVVINLLLNAIQASPPTSVVTVEIATGDPVRLRVIDHGCGIDAQHQTRIFEPFFSMRDGGTGLGLFLSLNFMRQCGGDIRVHSQPGRGATFEVAIPAVADVHRRMTA